MRVWMAGLAGAAVLAGAAGAQAHTWEQAGAMVAVAVEVEGARTPLYPARDGSGRLYVEARRGARYGLHLANRTAERLAVRITVDGLNVISGERQAVDQAGRMYVLGPWETAFIQGWRTSLQDVRRFTFVDEQGSYAARSGKANARMGWIELAVYRDRARQAYRTPPDVTAEREGSSDTARSAPAEPGPSAKARDRALGGGGARPEAYPGTGWGEQAHDPVRLVDFEPERHPAERVTMRYEYAPALRALGILPWRTGDRLRERESGQGFAQPPRW